MPELRGWKTRIDAIAEKAQKTFVIANNHFEGKAAVNALQLKSMVTGSSGEGSGHAAEEILGVGGDCRAKCEWGSE